MTTQKKWYVVDANGQTLGRIASEVAKILRGKHKPSYSPHIDNGDYVIVVNAEKVVLTGKKTEQKQYITHSGYPGGLKATPYRILLQKKPELVFRKAVRGMLPDNRLGRKMIKKLKVYRGPEHPHLAQQPEQLVIEV
ncbi:MAG: 50S ribosomal protein L13 [Clostridia bacterium]|nr:50S ribosomal protein L13 [Clostridia bacterium]